MASEFDNMSANECAEAIIQKQTKAERGRLLDEASKTSADYWKAMMTYLIGRLTLQEIQAILGYVSPNTNFLIGMFID
jgi:hypothetical protein